MYPKKQSFESLDNLIEESRLYDICFADFDDLLYVVPPDSYLIGNVYREKCHLL